MTKFKLHIMKFDNEPVHIKTVYVMFDEKKIKRTLDSVLHYKTKIPMFVDDGGRLRVVEDQKISPNGEYYLMTVRDDLIRSLLEYLDTGITP